MGAAEDEAVVGWELMALSIAASLSRMLAASVVVGGVGSPSKVSSCSSLGSAGAGGSDIIFLASFAHKIYFSC